MYAGAHIWVYDRFIATVGVFIMKVTDKAGLLLSCTFPFESVWPANGYPVIPMCLPQNEGQNHAIKKANKSFENVPSSSNIE
jgi:hypothetical protein